MKIFYLIKKFIYTCTVNYRGAKLLYFMSGCNVSKKYFQNKFCYL